MKKPLFGNKIVVYTDGGSRGNPGPAALGVGIEFGSPIRDKEIKFGSLIRGIRGPSTALRASKEYGEFLGTKTNNQAEYAALAFALKKIKQLIGKKKAKDMEIEVRMDSELIVKQMNAEYKIEEPDLQPLFLQIWNLRIDFKNVAFRHIPREQNKRADRMVNKTLDEVRAD